MKRIVILACTDRPESNTLRFSKYLKPHYEKLGVQASVGSLQDYPLEQVVGGKYGEKIPSVTSFNNTILEADGLVFVIPEYNGSFPGIFKMFIDYLPFPASFLGKPISFVGVANGAFGGLRAVEQAQQVVGYRNAYVFPERVFLARFSKNFSDENGLTEEMQQKLLRSQMRNFVTYINQTLPPVDLETP